MKKLFLLLVCLCGVLGACRETSVKVQHTEYPYAIIQGHRLIAFQVDEGGGISGKEEVRLPTEEAGGIQKRDLLETEEAGGIQKRDLLETDDAYYATTSSGKSNDNLIKISKKDWTVTTKPIKYQGMGLVAKGDYLYAVSTMGGLYKYDKNLEQVADNQLIQGNAVYDDLVAVGDDLYVLGGRWEYDDENNFHSENILCRLDDELNSVETIVLSDTGAIMNMIAVGNKLYMTMTAQGDRPDGEPAGADKILSYNTETGEQEIVHTGIFYPREIGYNAARDELYVHRDDHADKQDIYHLYSQDMELKDVLVYPLIGETEGFILERGKQYLYADSKKLLIRDFEKENLSEIPLDDFKLDATQSLVLLKK